MTHFFLTDVPKLHLALRGCDEDLVEVSVGVEDQGRLDRVRDDNLVQQLALSVIPHLKRIDVNKISEMKMQVNKKDLDGARFVKGSDRVAEHEHLLHIRLVALQNAHLAKNILNTAYI